MAGAGAGGGTVVAGGESSDFSGAGSCAITTTLSEFNTADYELEDARRWAEGEFSAQANVDLVKEGNEVYEPIEVLQPGSVRGRLSLGEASYYRETTGYEGCPGWVDYATSVSVEVKTGGATFAKEVPGDLRILQDDPVSRFVGRVDLAPEELDGLLEFGIEPRPRQAASLTVNLASSEEGRWGNFKIEVTEYAQPSDGADFRTAERLKYWEFRGEFPDNGCGAVGVPIGAAAPHTWLGGVSVEQLFAEWRGKGLRQLQRGSWSNGSQAEIDIDLGLPARSCLGGRHFGFEPTGNITTTDGRVAAPLTGGSASAQTDPRSLSLWSSNRYAAAEIEAMSGIHGVDVSGYASVLVTIDVRYDVTADPITSFGAVTVTGCDACPSCCSHPLDFFEWPVP